MLSAGGIAFFLTAGVFLVAAAVQLSIASNSGTPIPAAGFTSFEQSFIHLLTRLPLTPSTGVRRPMVGVIIENQHQAREGHAGLREALMVQEFLVEGGITRFLALFDASELPDRIGPVRSLRPYFVDAFQPISPVIFHAGGSPDAYNRAATLSGFLAINALMANESVGFIRDPDLFAPHNLFLTRSGALTVLSGGLLETLWPPFPTGSLLSSGSGATEITIAFGSAFYDIRFVYLPDTDRYARIDGGRVSDAQPRTIVILRMPILGVGEEGRLSIEPSGTGAMLFARGGRIMEGVWSKPDVFSPFAFLDEEGEPLPVSRGQIWMMMLPELERVSW